MSERPHDSFAPRAKVRRDRGAHGVGAVDLRGDPCLSVYDEWMGGSRPISRWSESLIAQLLPNVKRNPKPSADR